MRLSGIVKSIKSKMQDENVKSIQSKMQDESGQALVEYGLLLALIAVVAIGIVTTLGTQIQGTFADISGSLPKVGM